MVLLCLMPLSFKYLLNSWLVNGGLLSPHKTVGMPCVTKIRSSFGIVVDADVDRTILTSRNLEYASMTTNRYSPVGNGPQNQGEGYAMVLVVVVSFEGVWVFLWTIHLTRQTFLDCSL